jgi:anhydro-N-acetylmuramic acid kinase
MANPVNAIGLMSGTSMDGIDVAWMVSDGERHAEVHGFDSFAYTPAQRETLSQAMKLAAGLTGSHGPAGQAGGYRARPDPLARRCG